MSNCVYSDFHKERFSTMGNAMIIQLKSANPSSVRLRYLRGVSALATLPENHLLLLGSDSGNIALMA